MKLDPDELLRRCRESRVLTGEEQIRARRLLLEESRQLLAQPSRLQTAMVTFEDHARKLPPALKL